LDVVITSDPEKIPPEIRALRDEGQPLPPGAQFFEQRFTFVGLLKTALIGLVLALIGLITFIFFIAMVLDSFGPTTVASSTYSSQIIFASLAVSAVFWFGCYFMLSSLLPAARLAWSGRPSRYGITVFGDCLISYSLFDTTIIPRDKLTSITAGKVGYLLKGEEKSFALPSIVDNRQQQLEAVIRSWKSAQAET
jgi:hypothetical protein